MKLPVLLLLLLVALGSFIPCCTSTDCKDTGSHSRSTEQHSDHQEGLCSPFFACGICAGFVQSTHTIRIIHPDYLIPAHKEKPFAQSVSSYHFDFFQPPRIA